MDELPTIAEVRAYSAGGCADNTDNTALRLKRASKYIVVDGVERRRDVRPTSAVTFLVSAAVYTEFMTYSNTVTVSVECSRRYADCSRAKFGEDRRCGRSLCRTNRSITFEMVVRSVAGHQLLV